MKKKKKVTKKKVLKKVIVKRKKATSKVPKISNMRFCHKCQRRTKHKGQGKRYIEYGEYCVKCGNLNYSEYKRKDNGKL